MARRSTVGPRLLGPGLVADDRRNDARGTYCFGRRSYARRRSPVSPQDRGSRLSTPARLRSDRARSGCGEELRTPDPPRPHPRRTSAREARADYVPGDFGPWLATRHIVRHRRTTLAPARRRHRLADRRRLSTSAAAPHTAAMGGAGTTMFGSDNR